MLGVKPGKFNLSAQLVKAGVIGNIGMRKKIKKATVGGK